MKIAIIEDRLGRVEQFLEFDLQNCEQVTIVSGKEFDELILALDSKNTEILNQFDCIASHRSALTNQIRDVLKEYCKKNNRPLIFFSGGITSSVFKDVEFPFLHINSKDFYSTNLELFLNNCQENNSINLLMLQFGDRWKLSLLLNLRNRIAVDQNKQILKDSNPSIEFDVSEFIRRVRDLQIHSLIKPDLINEKTQAILSGDDSSPISPLQISEVRSVLNQLINKMS